MVLTGSCLDIGDASPLHPLLQALRRFDAELSAAQARTSSAVRGLLQMFADETAGPDGAGALLERVSRGLHLIAEGRPLVLILDDLQWVDRSTRQLLLYLLAGLGDLQLSVLAAVRAESLQGAHPLRRVLTELRRLRTVRVLDLAPLDRADTERLAAAVVGRTLAAGGRRAGLAAQRRQPVRHRGAGPRPARRPRRAVRDAAGDLPRPGSTRCPSTRTRWCTRWPPVSSRCEHWLLAEVLRLPEDGADRRGPGRGGAPAAGRRRRRLPAAAPARRRGARARAAAGRALRRCTAATPRR